MKSSRRLDKIITRISGTGCSSFRTKNSLSTKNETLWRSMHHHGIIAHASLEKTCITPPITNYHHLHCNHTHFSNHYSSDSNRTHRTLSTLNEKQSTDTTKKNNNTNPNEKRSTPRGKMQGKKYMKQKQGQDSYHDLASLSSRLSRITERTESVHVQGSTQSRSEEIFNITLYLDTKVLVMDLRNSIDRGLIMASGSDIHILSGICADVLQILKILPEYVSTIKKKNILMSPFDTCVQILEMIYDLGLDVTPNHIASAIHIACKEEKYVEAANLFQRLYDAEYNPFALSPVDPSLGKNTTLELGLFAMAKAAQQEKITTGSNTGDQMHHVANVVYEAVHEMTLLSSRDHDSYILGAISALGRAGEWKSCVNYLESNEGKVGQPSIAAVMNACLDCNQGSIALQIYQDRFLINQELFSLSEWQTGGTYQNILPACRNAALSAFRHIAQASTTENDKNESSEMALSAQAVNLLNDAIEADIEISACAVESVLFTCAHDNDWETACSIMEKLVDETVMRSNPITPPEKSIMYNNKTFFRAKENVINERTLPPITAEMVESVMRSCNNNEHFGIALYYNYLSNLVKEKNIPFLEDELFTNDGNGDDTFSWSFLQHETSKAVTLEAIRSLCGLEQIELAAELFDIGLIRKHANTSNKNNPDEVLESAKHIIANSEIEGSTQKLFQSSLSKSFQQIKLLQSKLLSSKIQPYESSDMDTSEAVANVMSYSTQMNQPMMGLIIGRRMAKIMVKRSSGISSIPPSLRDESLHVDKESKFLLSTDSILSATMKAYQNLGWDLTIFFEMLLENMSQDEKSNWPKSFHQCVLAMIAMGDVELANQIFLQMDKSSLDPDRFKEMAESLLNSKQWSEIIDLWNIAKEKTCLSEELGFITLKAVSNSSFKDENTKHALFGNIIWDLAVLSGTSKSNWKKSRYFLLKEEIIQKDLVKIMGWRKGEIKQGEIAIASDVYHNAKHEGEKVPDNVLLALVKKAGYKQRHVRCRGNPLPDKVDPFERSAQIKEREEGIASIFNLIDEARKSNFGDDPVFTLQVAQGFRALKANKEAIEFVKELVARRAEIRAKTFLQAVFAAKSSEDRVIRNEIVKLMEDSGFTYENHDDTFRENYS